MKTLLLAAAVTAAVGCSEPPSAAVRTPAPKTSTEPGSPAGSGSVDPTKGEPCPTAGVVGVDAFCRGAVTASTGASGVDGMSSLRPGGHDSAPTSPSSGGIAPTPEPEPIRCPGYGHPLHHLSCAEAAAAVARRAPADYDVPSPQARSVGRGTEPAGGDTWAALADCESGSANVDTGNGYSGFFQFSDATWRSMGTGYARAVDAPYSVQLAAAQRLQARSGWGQWPACTSQMGLR